MHIKNVDIRANLHITEDIVERIQARRQRYFGHVVRMDQHRVPNIVLYGRVEGKRVKGRHRKRWLDNVTDDCYHRGWRIVEATHLATDRQRWRTYIRLSQRAPASPWQQEDREEKKNVTQWHSTVKWAQLFISASLSTVASQWLAASSSTTATSYWWFDDVGVSAAVESTSGPGQLADVGTSMAL